MSPVGVCDQEEKGRDDRGLWLRPLPQQSPAEDAKIQASRFFCLARFVLRSLKTGRRAGAFPRQPVDAQCSKGSNRRIAISELVENIGGVGGWELTADDQPYTFPQDEIDRVIGTSQLWHLLSARSRTSVGHGRLR